MKRFIQGAKHIVIAVAAFVSLGHVGHAQPRPDDTAAAVAPFPEGDIYRLQVTGDAFAEGLAPALADVLQTEQRLQVNRKHRPIGGLVRSEWEEDIKAEEANRETPHIVVLMTGLYDKQVIRMPNVSRPLSVGSDDWKEEYARRFERLIKAVKKRNTAVYVIGQPILRSTSQNTQAEMISDVMRQRAAANGAKFIDIHETFQDDSGGFSQFGPDFNGNRVKLREGDGVLLTSLGNRKLALVIERDLKRDLAQAAADRAIPLAGDEAEQKRVSAARVSAGNLTSARPSAIAAGRPAVPSQVPVAPQSDSSGDQKADNGRVVLRLINAAGREETATIDIVRPAIPAAVIALLTRREGSGDRAQQPGEGVVEDVGAGLTVVNSVSTLGDASAQGSGRRVQPAAQTAFDRVLVKGERMPSKPGRADDLSWPRTDPFAAVAASPTAQPPSRAQPSTPRSAPASAKSTTR